MRATAVVGAVAVVFGFVVVIQRGIAGLFDLTYVFVTGAGILALVQGIRYANDARSVGARASETGDPEDRYEVPVPGDDDDELVSSSGFSRSSIKRRREFHRHLHRVAAETLRSRGDYTADEVEAAVDGGTWTDDPVAAWFLGTDVPPPPAARVRSLIGSDVEFRFGVRRSVDALAAARDRDCPGRDDDIADRYGEGRRATARHAVEAARAAGRRRIDAVRDTLGEVRR